MNINDNTDTVSDADVQFAALAADADYQAWCDARDAERNALAEEPEPVTVRSGPEYRDVTDPQHDALGQINPADRDAFAEWCVGRWVPKAFRVDELGRVFVRSGYVCEGEAEMVGKSLAEFNAERALAIDPAHCPTGAGKQWCPRCGFGCCTVRPDPENRDRLVCSGGCDAHGHHHETNVA